MSDDGLRTDIDAEIHRALGCDWSDDATNDWCSDLTDSILRLAGRAGEPPTEHGQHWPVRVGDRVEPEYEEYGDGTVTEVETRLRVEWPDDEGNTVTEWVDADDVTILPPEVPDE